MRTVVTLHTEQEATLTVDAPEGSSKDELTRLALLELDRSGGAEWQTVLAWTETQDERP